ncbi:MAG: endonuclease IV [Firmicutes bacterium]|nr:endonuclease IV [Bacillota bacterium]MBO2521628.1 endonuclease IV [Bacillota bacterium]
MRIGCHLSVSKGFDKMVERALEVGADVVQYFPKNPKSYRPKSFDPDEYREMAKAAAQAGVASVCHSPYVTNLSTPDPSLRAISIASIVNDLEIADAFGTDYLVVHCGKHVGEGRERGEQLMADAINRVLEQFDGKTMFLMENTAGQGSELGQTIEELLSIYQRIEDKSRVGVCFDTCHGFASGLLDFDDWDRFAAEFFDDAFFPLVKVIHLNDSKAPKGARRDRHELLGQGEIGVENLRRFLAEPRIRHLPVIIETPVADELDYADEIRKAREWAGI